MEIYRVLRLPRKTGRQESWNLIRRLSDESQLSWCVRGDFNDVMYVHEMQGGTPHPRALLEGLKEVVSECGLRDMGFIDNEFMWERSRGSESWVQERLYRGLANQEWRNLFPQATVKVLEVSKSDHMPLFLELNRMIYTSRVKKLHFENNALK